MKATRLDEALDALDGAGTAEVSGEGGGAEIDCAEVGPIGVRVNRVRISRVADADVVREAEALPERTRSLGERLRAVEVDAGLGGATLRTDPSDMHDNEYFEVDVRPRHTDVRRVKVGDDGERRPTDFAVTRKQLRGILDELRGEEG